MTLQDTRETVRYEFKSNYMKLTPYKGQLHQKKTQKQQVNRMAAINQQNEIPNPAGT